MRILDSASMTQYSHFGGAGDGRESSKKTYKKKRRNLIINGAYSQQENEVETHKKKKKIHRLKKNALFPD